MLMNWKIITTERIVGMGLALFILIAGACFCLLRYQPLTFLIGDGPYYAETSVSLLYDHDLDLRNQLTGGLLVHGGQIALGANGAWYPKHPLLMPVAMLPALFLFGLPGLLGFNLLVLAALGVAMFALARRYAPAGPSSAAVCALIFGTFMRGYIYNLSPDLFAALILGMGILVLLEDRTGAGGLWLGAAVLAKVLLLVALPFGLAFAASRRGARGAARFLAGCAVPLLLLGAMNLRLFGSPFVTAYDRNVAIEDGRTLMTSHRSQFDIHLLHGLAGELLDPTHGVLTTAPLLLLAIPGSLIVFGRRRADAILLVGIPVATFLLLSAYRSWASSHVGNRFLIPSMALATPALALVFDRLWARRPLLRARAAPPSPALP